MFWRIFLVINKTVSVEELSVKWICRTRLDKEFLMKENLIKRPNARSDTAIQQRYNSISH